MIEELKKLHKNQFIWRKMAASAPLLWIRDECNRYLYVNDRARTIIGDTTDPINKSDSDFFEPGITEILDQMSYSALNSGEVQQSLIKDLTVSSPDTFVDDHEIGTTYHLSSIAPFYTNDMATPSGTVHWSVDTTQSVLRSEETINANYNSIFTDLFGHSESDWTGPAEFEYLHDLNGRFLSMTDNLLRSLGLTPETVAQVNLVDLVAPRFRRLLQNELKSRFEGIRKTGSKNLWKLSDSRIEGSGSVWVVTNSEKVRVENKELVRGKGWIIGQTNPSSVFLSSRIIRGGNVAGWERELGTNRLYVTEHWKRLLGISASENVTYHEFRSRIHPHDRVRVFLEMSAHLNGRADSYNSRYRMLHNDKNYRWMHAVGHVTFSPDGTQYVSGYNIDITEEMKIADELVEKETLIRTIVDTDPALIFIKDENGRLVFINRALAALYKTTVQEAIKRTDRSFFEHMPHDPSVEDLVKQQLEQFEEYDRRALDLAEGSSCNCREFIIPPNGDMSQGRWYQTVKTRASINHKPHILGISSDITELVLEKELYENLIELSPAPMYVKSSSGAYVMVNSSFVRLVGKNSKDEVIGKSGDDFFPLCSKEIIEADAEVLSSHGNGGTVNVDRELVRFDGKRLHLLENKSKARVINHGSLDTVLIGCDLDQTEAIKHARNEAIAAFEHSIKSIAGDYLQECHRLVMGTKSVHTQSELLNAAKRTLRTAIYLSGTQPFLRYRDFEHENGNVSTFAQIFQESLQSRLMFLDDYSSLCGKSLLIEGTPSEFNAHVSHSFNVITCALDIVVINAIDHGGNDIKVSFLWNEECIDIVVHDNGAGIPENKKRELADFRPGSESFYDLQHFGLKAAKTALAGCKMTLTIDECINTAGASVRITIPIIKETLQNDETNPAS
ncbi:MAG: PAS domain S-box protein [Pirellulales bacterium]